MQTYQRIRRKKVCEINVVPYIDVMLVLLIIFMAVTPVITGSDDTSRRSRSDSFRAGRRTLMGRAPRAAGRTL
mgnify:CR=1 FL=1